MSLPAPSFRDYDFCPDCEVEHSCGYCHDTGILVGARWGSDNMDVVFRVAPCVDCTAVTDREVPADVFGSYTDDLPEHVRIVIGDRA